LLITAYSIRATSKVVETVWIFEKETSRLFDDTPIYEGVIIEYLHRLEVSHKYKLHFLSIMGDWKCRKKKMRHNKFPHSRNASVENAAKLMYIRGCLLVS